MAHGKKSRSNAVARNVRERSQREAAEPVVMTDDEALAYEADCEMFGDEDAAYFHYAGIDDIGNK